MCSHCMYMHKWCTVRRTLHHLCMHMHCKGALMHHNAYACASDACCTSVPETRLTLVMNTAARNHIHWPPDLHVHMQTCITMHACHGAGNHTVP